MDSLCICCLCGVPVADPESQRIIADTNGNEKTYCLAHYTEQLQHMFGSEVASYILRRDTITLDAYLMEVQ